MSDLVMWELIAGFVSATFILPVIQQPTWTEKRRAGVTFIYSLIVGLGTAYMTGALDSVRDLRTGISGALLLLVTSISVYKGFAKPRGIAPAIEDATSPKPT